MFRNLNRTYLVVGLLLVGTCSSVFAIDFSQALSQSKEQSQGIETLFQGKAQVSNLYQKALKLSKDREITATTTSLDQLKQYYSDCNGIKNSDFVNVLYNSNSSFKITFEQLFTGKNQQRPTLDEINTSYDKFYACKGIKTTHTATDKLSVDNEVQNVYLEGYYNAFTLSTLNQDNFGSDLLRNGTLDDSDFDLLYDINQIGKILFEDFTDSPQILFYRLPEAGSSLTQGGGDLSSLSDQVSYQVGGGVGGGGGSSLGTTGSSVGGSLTGNGVTPFLGSLSQSQITTNTNPPSLSDDKEVQNFVDSTNPSSTIPGVVLLLGNQCLSGDTSAPVVEEQPVLEDPAAYISGIVNFINNANVNDVINNNLLAIFNKDHPLPTGGSTSDSGYAATIANSYAEQAFGEAAPGTCEYGCKDLPLIDQTLCQLKCVKVCIQKCDDTSKINQSACTTNYTDEIAACDAQDITSSSACNTTYTKETTACDAQNITSSSTCDANYTDEVAFCDTLPVVERPICKTTALTKKGLCLANIPLSKVKKIACNKVALAKQSSCLTTSLSVSALKKVNCKPNAVAARTACIEQTVTEQALCVSDCTCFMIAGPLGSGYEKIENMFRIKFCKVPVQSNVVEKRTKVFSIYAIFKEISDVLEGLKNSGQMVEFTKKKEFLDSNIKINFSDLFSFKLQVNFKPLFAEKSTSAKTKEQEQDMRDLSLGIMDMNVGSPSADDYNKYIVISNPPRNDATMEEASSLGDIQQTVANFTVASQAAKAAQISSPILTDFRKTYVSKNSVSLVQNMISFLDANQTFWHDMSLTLYDMTQMSIDLKSKIDASASKK